MSIDLLERAAASLGPLLDEVAFLGGASLALWMTDSAAPDPRVTLDVDVIVVINTRLGYYDFGERLRRQGFTDDAESGIVCRWRHATGLILDVMPTDDGILGFANRWYPDAIAAAEAIALPSGVTIRAVRPAYLVATKLEAYGDRGNNDMLRSVDFEDIVRLIDGREELRDEIAQSPLAVRSYIVESLTALGRAPLFETAVAGALLPDSASQGRLPLVLDRIEHIRQVQANPGASMQSEKDLAPTFPDGRPLQGETKRT